MIVPLTTSGKPHPLRMSIGKINNKENYALIGQLKTVDIKRITEKMGYLDKELFIHVKNAVKAML